MKNKITWGVIGSGGIARRRTIPEGLALAVNAELHAVYDIDPAVNTEVARQFGVTPATSLEGLLAMDLDAIYIATPAFLHRTQVLAAARAGKHILCEKPLGMNVAEAEEMIADCQNSGVQLGTAFMMRFHSQHQAALKLIRDGRLGRPVYARAQLSCWYPPIPGAWRQVRAQGGGGALMDMGGHCIDLLEMFFGPVCSVNCMIRNIIHSYETEDAAMVQLDFKNGALASVDTFFCIQDQSSKNVLELYGSQGGILAKGTIGQGSQGEMRSFLTPETSGYEAAQARSTEEGQIIDPPPINIYRSEIEGFSRDLLEKRPSCLDSPIGLHSQRVLAACYESAAKGATVKVVQSPPE
jgi:predicted dehydrogenase